MDESEEEPGPPVIQALAPHHDRAAFRSGVAALDVYLQAQAGQDAKRHVAAPYVLVVPPSPKILGYYTLSNTSMVLRDLPAALSKRLPRYPVLPATLLGRLAVDDGRRGRGLGVLLLLDALRRCLKSETASLAVVVDAKDEAAERFYLHHDFLRFEDQPRRLFLPTAAIAKLFEGAP